MTALSFTRTSPHYSAPTVTDGIGSGFSLASATTREEWGTLRVEIGAVWEWNSDPEVLAMEKTADGDDWTEYRDARTLVTGLSWTDPFGEEDGSITVPALTPWDIITTAGFGGPIPRGTNIDIWRVLPATLAATYSRAEVPFWHGIVLDPVFSDGPGSPDGVTYQLMGALVGEATARAHQPQPLDDSRDIGTVIAQACDTRDSYSRPLPGWRFDLQVTTTGIETRMRGSTGDYVIDFLREVLGIAQDADTFWTIARAFDEDDFPRARMYVLRDTTTPSMSATIRGGTPGFSWAPRTNITDDPNAVYGEGVRPDGGRWRNMVYPQLRDEDAPTYPGAMALGDVDADFAYDAVTALQYRLRSSGWPDVSITGEFDADTVTGLNAMYADADHDETGEIESSDDWDLCWETSTDTTDLSSGYRRPLARDTRVDPYTYAPDGSVTGANDDFDPTVLRVDRLVSYGDRIRKSRARINARRIINDFGEGVLIHATATLAIDPEECSRLSLRETGALVVDYTASGEDALSRALTMRVQRWEIAPEADDFPVEMILATRPYSSLDLRERILRNREARENPARAFYSQMHRVQRPWRDVTGWDCELGGDIPPTLCAAGEWTVIKFAAGQRGTIAATRASSSPASRFGMALFGDEIDAAGVTALVADPLSEGPTSAGWWAEVSESDLRDAEYLEAWGQYAQACGYYPYAESDDPTPATTGKMRDFASFTYESGSPPFLWLAIWSEDEATYTVDMRIIGEE